MIKTFFQDQDQDTESQDQDQDQYTESQNQDQGQDIFFKTLTKTFFSKTQIKPICSALESINSIIIKAK